MRFKRDYNCSRYKECLDEAAKLNFLTLNCGRCAREKTAISVVAYLKIKRTSLVIRRITKSQMRNCSEVFTTA